MDEKFFTECPHCRTAFRVVRNSIGSSQGWVKCGRCRKIFNANINEVDPTGSNKEKIDEHNNDLILTNVANKKKIENAPQMPLFQNLVAEQAEKPKKTINRGSPVTNSRWQALKADNLEKGSLNVSALESIEESAVQVDTDKLKERPSLADIQAEEVLAIKGYQTSKSTQKPTELDSIKASGAVNNEPDKATAKKTSHFDTVSAQSNQKSRQREAARLVGEQKNQPVTLAAKPAQWLWSASMLLKSDRIKDRKHVHSQSNFKSIILSVLLTLLLFWQVNIVSYNNLLNYDFLKPYLNVACLVFVCNKSSLAKNEIFDIFQAGIKPHPQLPGIFNLTARLINYSDSDQLLPSVILDLTNQRGNIIASKRVNLVENPQYIEPSVRQLIPGQDVKLIFNIDQLQSNAVGFNLRLQP